MPLIIRGNDRKAYPVATAAALEIVDNEGRLAVVITQSASGSVQITTPGTPLFEQYCRRVGALPSRVHVHEDYGKVGK